MEDDGEEVMVTRQMPMLVRTRMIIVLLLLFYCMIFWLPKLSYLQFAC